MMKAKEYIESGILNDYCLGLLNAEQEQEVKIACDRYPELKKELEIIQASLDQYAASMSEIPPQTLAERIWNQLENLSQEEEMEINSLGILNKYSDKDQWLRAVKPLLPAKLAEEMFVKTIRNDEEATQIVIWTRVDYPDEVHDDLQECFMILEGECECYIGDDVIRLGPGGYFDVPLHEHHDVKILSEYVLAVVQRRRVA
jgi:mannose-6-phosphate isomerase-like protein (cupin superfamily)